MIRSLIQLAARSSVQPARDEWVRPGDERSAAATSGGSRWAGGADGRPSVRAVHGIVICLVAATSAANAFSAARDIPWRVGTPHNLWEPTLWSLTSGVVVVATLPIVRGATMLLNGGVELWLRDGRLGVSRDIVSVSSAYVEYELTDQRKHLILPTLQAELSRLAPFGIVRVHWTRLINLKRIVALQWGPSDFKIGLDSGEIVPRSRRFKSAIKCIAA